MSPDAPKTPAARAAYYDRLVQTLTSDRDTAARYGTFLNAFVNGKGAAGMAHLAKAAEQDPELAKRVQKAALAARSP